MKTIAAGLGVEDAAQGLYDLAKRLGAKLSLAEIGMPEDGLDKAAQLASEGSYPNPRPVEYAAVRQLLEDAYRGKRPD
jgi:alcohol dehydrogenase class IV